jgi:hypothetical protein
LIIHAILINKSTNYPTLKKIQNSVCPSLSGLYLRVKSINNITTLDSSIVADMDGIAGGASIADINSMSPEVWLSFSSNSLKNMPADTVNALPSSVLKLTTTSQLAAFYTSPYYSSYSDSVKSTLTQLTNVQIVTTSSDNNIVIISPINISTVGANSTVANRNINSGSDKRKFNFMGLIISILIFFSKL